MSFNPTTEQEKLSRSIEVFKKRNGTLIGIRAWLMEIHSLTESMAMKALYQHFNGDVNYE